ncbi:MAG TPA: M48 family metallopeptidase [Bdellovibrionota bacterium]|jgi:hypothetical protein|nr:M48 family metallopeptidase [Bdellovibrionota bacterium]
MRTRKVALLLTLLTAAGCMPNRLELKRPRDLPSEAQGVESNAAVEILRSQFGGLDDSPDLWSASHAVLGRLLKGRKEEREVRFIVLNTGLVNAFSLPDGHIVLTRGLFEVVRTEGELAAVLAHEIGHLELKHYESQRGRTWYTVGMPFVEPALSRADEAAADARGTEIMLAAGYSPVAGARFFERLARYQDLNGGQGLWILNTHPNSMDRAKELRAAAEKAKATAESVSGPEFVAARRHLSQEESAYLGSAPAVVQAGDLPWRSAADGAQFKKVLDRIIVDVDPARSLEALDHLAASDRSAEEKAAIALARAWIEAGDFDLRPAEKLATDAATLVPKNEFARWAAVAFAGMRDADSGRAAWNRLWEESNHCGENARCLANALWAARWSERLLEKPERAWPEAREAAEILLRVQPKPGSDAWVNGLRWGAIRRGVLSELQKDASEREMPWRPDEENQGKPQVPPSVADVRKVETRFNEERWMYGRYRENAWGVTVGGGAFGFLSGHLRDAQGTGAAGALRIGIRFFPWEVGFDSIIGEWRGQPQRGSILAGGYLNHYLTDGTLRPFVTASLFYAALNRKDGKDSIKPTAEGLATGLQGGIRWGWGYLQPRPEMMGSLYALTARVGVYYANLGSGPEGGFGSLAWSAVVELELYSGMVKREGPDEWSALHRAVPEIR